MGWCLQNGLGVEQDYTRAQFWYRKGAERGCAAAQNHLGESLLDGRVHVRNETQAAAWYRKAAEQGHAQAQYNLGMCYQMACGVEKDDIRAAFWLRQAAEQGHEEAGKRLHELGVNERDRRSKRWIKA